MGEDRRVDRDAQGTQGGKKYCEASEEPTWLEVIFLVNILSEVKYRHA